MPQVEVIWSTGVKETYDNPEIGKESYGLVLKLETKEFIDRIPMLNVVRVREYKR